MSLAPPPIIYLITSGLTTSTTTPSSNEYHRITQLIAAAVAAGISLVQIREKQLTTRVLCALTADAAAITRNSTTRLLVNDRSDVAVACGADGVHLTAQSLPGDVIRKTHGPDLIIGCSTHSLAEICAARDSGADFAVFGPVFGTASKRAYGAPQGLDRLREVTRQVDDFPVLAIGGINLTNCDDCFRAGASGVAAITMFGDTDTLTATVERVRKGFHSRQV